MASGTSLVETSDPGLDRRLFEGFGILLGFPRDLLHGGDEEVEGLLALRLRRFDHERAMDDQGEVDRGRVETEIDQALGDVECRDAEALLPVVVEHAFVHTTAGVGDVIMLLEMRQEVVRVEDGHLCDPSEIFGAHLPDVGVGAHEDAEVAVEGAQFSDRIGVVVIEMETPLLADDPGEGEEGFEAFSDRDGAGARPSSAMGRREGLVQVEMEDIDPHLPRFEHTEHGVHVRTVAVDESPTSMDDFRDLDDMGFEEAERVGVRDHEGGDLFVHETFDRLRFEDPPLAGGSDDDLVAAERGAGRIRSVRGVGDDHLLAGIALFLVIGTDHPQAGELAMGAGGRVEGDGIEAGDPRKRLLEFVHELEESLDRFLRKVGVRLGESGERGGHLVDLRVVLHRAGTERVETGIDPIVPLREAGVVPHDLHLVEFGHPRDILAEEFGGNDRFRRNLRHLAARKGEARAPRRALLEEERLLEHEPRNSRKGSTRAPFVLHASPPNMETSASMSLLRCTSVTQTSRSRSSPPNRERGTPGKIFLRCNRPSSAPRSPS